MFRVVGSAPGVGKFDGGFDLIEKEFDGLGWIEGCAYFGVVVLNVDGCDDAPYVVYTR